MVTLIVGGENNPPIAAPISVKIASLTGCD